MSNQPYLDKKQVHIFQYIPAIYSLFHPNKLEVVNESLYNAI